MSTAVVSYVVNSGPRPVAPATRQRVLDAMAALGYRPNAAARALRLRRATAIGLVVPDVSNTYFGALARELSDRAFTAGYGLLLGDSNNDPERERAQVESLVDRQVDGLIVLSLEPGSTVELRGTPTVYLDQRSRPGQASIVIDNAGGARTAVEHLVGHGRRRIAHLGGLAGAPGADDRARGWREALARAGLESGADLSVQADYSREGGHAAARDLLSRRPRVDAVFVASDVQALGLLRAARELGISVPQDLAVVSFDGTADAVFSDPPLTAVEQPLARIADAALSAVLGQPPPRGRQQIAVDLVIRRSCGCTE
ncbi:LacI family transcriptional regulator [Pseudolysinimonas yzui]|uniref:LacI family transcriptional regulator n=1 Tax=Pseudolysinimonas yzui TaxID=2708254 RepID=A0A8J3M080_9MICO|nr:LacI family transcriptional regulator [Pseudolysinimonas yzui]